MMFNLPAVNASNTVLNVFEVARNMFYRHKACLMYNSGAALFAFTWAEIPFILLAAAVFVVPFYFLCGLALDAGKFFLYYLFIVLDIGLFTFNGQVRIFLEIRHANLSMFWDVCEALRLYSRTCCFYVPV